MSNDEGESYTPHYVKFALDKVLFHPDNEDKLLGYDKINAAVSL